MKNTATISEKGKEDMAHVSVAMKNLNTTILELIKAVEEVDESSEKINSIVQIMIDKLTKVDEVATSEAAITEEQSAAAEEILATSENLANHSKKVTENHLVVETDANNLATTAQKLKKQMELFKI